MWILIFGTFCPKAVSERKKKRERKKLSRCFGFSFFFAVPNIFYRYRTIENFYAHHIIINKYIFEMVYPIFWAEN